MISQKSLILTLFYQDVDLSCGGACPQNMRMHAGHVSCMHAHVLRAGSTTGQINVLVKKCQNQTFLRNHRIWLFEHI